MKSSVRTWPLTLLMGTLLWATCSTAPMQCHFNSRGEVPGPVEDIVSNPFLSLYNLQFRSEGLSQG